MTEPAERFKAELVRQSAQERAELAQFLIHSLDDEANPASDELWEAELMRRQAEITDGTAHGRPFEAVMAELRVANDQDLPELIEKRRSQKILSRAELERMLDATGS